MITQITRTAGVLVTVLFAPGVQAEIFKWQDEAGKVHYSQTPPVGVGAEVFKPIVLPPHSGQPDEALQKRVEGFDERRDAREKSEAEQAEHKEAEEIQAENCQRARDNLTALQTHGRVSIREGDTYRALSEEERQAKISEADGYVSQFCRQVAGGK